jgi:hypothetical protein
MATTDRRLRAVTPGSSPAVAPDAVFSLTDLQVA